MDLLEVQDIAVAYGKLRAVKDVSFRVRRGEVVALLGSNGSGKSTLLRTIAGVLTPSAGRVLFDGGDITGWPSHRVARRGLRLVPEGRGLLARMSVWENLLMGQYAGGGDARDLDAALARFPVLGQRRQQIASTLSGGEQQMLAIARALVARPSLLMLDEPSLGLAPRLIREVFQVVADLKREGVTIVLVEQNARQALAVADRAYILETGQVALSGPAAELAAGEAVQQAYLGVAPRSSHTVVVRHVAAGDAAGGVRSPGARPHGSPVAVVRSGPGSLGPPSPSGGWVVGQSDRWRLARRALRSQRRRRLAMRARARATHAARGVADSPRGVAATPPGRVISRDFAWRRLSSDSAWRDLSGATRLARPAWRGPSSAALPDPRDELAGAEAGDGVRRVRRG